MFGPSYNVKGAVWKVLNKRIEDAQADIDAKIDTYDKEEEEAIKKVKADTVNRKGEALEKAVAGIIK